jgi:mRNA interferase RelE/StbE
MTRYLGEDQQGLLELFGAVDGLADGPRPPDSRDFGSRDRRRLHVGRYRVLYQVRDDLDTVTIAHVGAWLPMCRASGHDGETTLTLYDVELILAGCWWTGRRSSTAG